MIFDFIRRNVRDAFLGGVKDAFDVLNQKAQDATDRLNEPQEIPLFELPPPAKEEKKKGK